MFGRVEDEFAAPTVVLMTVEVARVEVATMKMVTVKKAKLFINLSRVVLYRFIFFRITKISVYLNINIL